MQLVASIARVACARRILDLGCGIGYSTLWLAHGAGARAHVLGIDGDLDHVVEASSIVAEFDMADRVEFRTGLVAQVLSEIEGGVDMIHDDAWFGRAPEHLDRALWLLRPGGVLTMANWFLLVDALSGEPGNDWEEFAGPDWASDVTEFAGELATRNDVVVNWIQSPPLAIVTKC